MKLLQRKVGKVWVVAETEKLLAEACETVKRKEPLLCQCVRLKDGPVLGWISAIDKSRKEPRVQVNEGPTWIRWSRLEYV